MNGHGEFDVLQLALPQPQNGLFDLVFDLTSHVLRNANASRRCQRLNLGGDIDPVSVEVVFPMLDIAQVQSDAKLKPLLER